MVGPSSSHTAGAVRLGGVARALFGELPDEVTIILYGSFGEVYDGHGTDTALVAGVLGLHTHNPEIKRSLEIAQEKGMKVSLVAKPEGGKHYHPNTAKFYFQKGDRKMMVLGSSVGGGLIEITKVDDMPVTFNGESDLIIFTARGDIDVLNLVYGQLHPFGSKLLQMFSHEKRDTGYNRFIIEVDKIPDDLLSNFKDTVGVTRVSVIPHLSPWEGVDDTTIPVIS